MLKDAGVAPEDADVELLCRLSQLIEELPWLAELHADLLTAGSEGGGKPSLGGELRIAFTPPS
jgi:hypothetical protein